jgi:hypothetical protein
MAAVIKPAGVGALTPGMSWADYRAIQAVNFSTLKVLDVSGRHYRHNLEHPKETDTLRLGQAAHCAVLEPGRFDSDFAVWRERKVNGDSAARKGKDWDEFVAAHPGCTFITEDQETDALTMQLAIRSDPEAMKYLGEGESEVTLQWCIGQRPCKGRVDFLADLGHGPVLVGVKTAADIRLEQFGRTAARLLYHCQWPFYMDGYEAITGVRPVEIVEIVVEKSPPHDVVVYVIDDAVLELGRQKYLQLLERLDECERAQRWPGVGGGGKQLFQLPRWMYDEGDLSDTGLMW